MDRFQLVLLHQPSYGERSKDIRDYFGKLLALRIQGYFHEHGHRYIPVDIYDHFASHLLLLCNGEAVACARIVDHAACVQHELAFPPVTLLSQSGSPSAVAAVQQFVQQYGQQGGVGYDSAFTLCPAIRQQRLAATVVKVMHGLWMLYHHNSQPRRFVVSATLRLKTERLFSKLGCAPVCCDPYFQLHSINSELAMMMLFSRPSALAQEWMAHYQTLWDARIELGTPFSTAAIVPTASQPSSSQRLALHG
ncbi:hypothetical protein [Pokkaliibacter plantistimulans]|uniref:hypothetical protein n=1 Tax=Pokkaliibacter plantistimulans TaxID=1635171 RepID=UPI0026D6072D|nr:hypothetical protein [Pokkaliibacter plantistimulans]